MAVTAIESISEMDSSERKQVFSTGEVATILLRAPLLIHEGCALLILCQSKEQKLILLDAANPGQQVMVIALDSLEEEMQRSLARSR